MSNSLTIPLLVALTLLACNGEGDANKTPPCTPSCEDKECGADGCGGTCAPGCDDGLECTNDSCKNGKCDHATQPVYCLILGTCVSSGALNPEDSCSACSPKAAQQGWSPVEDGIACGADKVCFEGACCDFGENCSGKDCGKDGCGGMCGVCPEGGTCNKKGICEFEVCEPDCEGLECGGDGCEGSCGECKGDYIQCVDGTCVCVPDCEGRECGDDGCGDKCGLCQGVNVICTDQGLCECAGPKCDQLCCGPSQVCTQDKACCTPQCEKADGTAMECGEDGCGGVCGTCQGGEWVACVEGTCVCKGTLCPKACCANFETCDNDGNCCNEQCAGKECGDNGCGGVCGTCPPGGMCLAGLCPPPGKSCNDGNDIPWDGCTDDDLSEFLVNTYVDDWQEEPIVAAFPAGGFLVIWRSKAQDGDLKGLFAQRYNADGSEKGTEFQVTSETEDDQEEPSIAVFSDNRFVVAYESWGLDGNGDAVAGQFFGADGSKSGAELVVNTTTLGDQRRPEVAVLADANTVVIWDGTNLEADPNGVYGQILDEAGDKTGAEFAVNTHTAGEQKHADVSRVGDGFVVTWQSEAQDTNGYGVFARLFQGDGQPAGDEFQVNDYITSDQQDPVIVPLTGGGFAIGWLSLGQDTGGYGIVIARFDADALPVAMEFVANTFTGGDQKDLALAPTEDGGFLAAWASKGQDGSDYGVFVRRFAADGTGVYEEFQANTFTDSIQRQPGIVAQSGQSMAVVWHGWEQAGAGYDIYAARFDKDGNLLYH